MRTAYARASLVALFLAMLAGGFLFTSAGLANTFQPADEGQETYIVTILSVTQAESVTGARQVAVVRYSGAWTGDAYPGRAQCRIEVHDSLGNVVGAKEFELGAYVPSFTTQTDLPVNGIPSVANAICSAATKPPPSAGYSLSNPRVVGRGEDVKLLINVEWLTDESPSYQDCQVVFGLADGQTSTYDFGIELPDKSTGTILLPPEFADATPTSLSCERV